MKKDLKPLGRLALRHEGENWNAYYALEGTMKDAIFLGSIRMGIVEDRPKIKELFMTLMREVVADILEEQIGQRPTWGGLQTAPESERSGHG